MSTITTSSTYADVLLALNKRTVSTTGWKNFDPPKRYDFGTSTVVDITSWTGSVGLFGDDFTDFFENCATVGYDECNPAETAAYSGWAIGVEIKVKTNLASSELAGACFGSGTTPNCVVIEGASSDLYLIKSWTDSAAVATSADGSATTALPVSVPTN